MVPENLFDRIDLPPMADKASQRNNHHLESSDLTQAEYPPDILPENP